MWALCEHNVINLRMSEKWENKTNEYVPSCWRGKEVKRGNQASVMMDQRRREEKVEKEEACVRGGERRRRAGVGILFFFLWQIDVIHLNHVTCATHSLSDQRHATPKGNWNCIVVPHQQHPHPLFSSFPSCLFFLSGNKRRSMSSILPGVWANKTTACSYM